MQLYVRQTKHKQKPFWKLLRDELFCRIALRSPERKGEVKILMWRLSQSAFYWCRVKGPQAWKRIKPSLEFAATTIRNGMTLVFFISEFLVWSEGWGIGYSKTASKAIWWERAYLWIYQYMNLLILHKGKMS